MFVSVPLHAFVLFSCICLILKLKRKNWTQKNFENTQENLVFPVSRCIFSFWNVCIACLHLEVIVCPVFMPFYTNITHYFHSKHTYYHFYLFYLYLYFKITYHITFSTSLAGIGFYVKCLLDCTSKIVVTIYGMQVFEVEGHVLLLFCFCFSGFFLFYICVDVLNDITYCAIYWR